MDRSSLTGVKDTDLVLHKFCDRELLFTLSQLNKVQFQLITHTSLSDFRDHKCQYTKLTQLIDYQIYQQAIDSVKQSKYNIAQSIYNYYIFPKNLSKRRNIRNIFNKIDTEIIWDQEECIPLHLLYQNNKWKQKVIKAFLTSPTTKLSIFELPSLCSLEEALQSNNPLSLHFALEQHVNKGDNDDLIADAVIKLLKMACDVPGSSMVDVIIGYFQLDVNKHRICYNALRHACYKGNLELVKFLINKGINPIKDQLPLICACQGGHLSIVKLLIEKGADISSSYQHKNDGYSITPLETAAMCGNGYDIIKLFIENGVEITCKSFVLSLHPVSLTKESYDVVKLLLDNGAIEYINRQDLYFDDDTSSLMYACSHKNEKINADIVKLLIENGVDMELKDNQGSTALVYACLRGFDRIVKVLINYGANINVKPHIGTGMSAFEIACYYGHYNVVKILIENGVDKDINYQLGKTLQTLLISAYRSDDTYPQKKEMQIPLIKLLIKHGADICLKNIKGNTALIMASSDSDEDINVEIVKSLIKSGANINEKANNGRTALMSATCYGNTKIVKELVEAGADITIKDNLSETALDLAVIRGHETIADFLKEINQTKVSDGNIDNNNKNKNKENN